MGAFDFSSTKADQSSQSSIEIPQHLLIYCMNWNELLGPLFVVMKEYVSQRLWLCDVFLTTDE